MRRVIFPLLLLIAVPAAAQRPAVHTTIQTTSTAASSLLVGCALGATSGCTGGINSGAVVVNSGGINLVSSVPGDTSMKLYNDAGTLKWNGITLATGASVSGTNGTLPVFTASNAIGDSIVTQTGGNTITVTGTFNATSAIQLNGASLNTAGTLSNVAYLNAANTFSNASGQTFAGGIGLSGGSPSTHGIVLPSAVPGVTTTNLYNDAGRVKFATTSMAYLTDTLNAFAATTSAQLASVISDETGSGSLVFATSPTLTTPNLGTPSAVVLTNATSIPAGQLTGSIADARLSSNVALLGDNETVTGAWSFSAAVQIANGAAINELSFTGTDSTNVLSATTGTFQLGTTTTGAFSLITNNTARISVTSAGLVGVGRSNNGTARFEVLDNMSVHSTGGAAVYLYGGGSGTTQMFSFRELGTYVDIGSIQNIYLAFNTNSTERLRIGATGNVGIAATARMYWDGVALSGNTYTLESAADTLDDVVGGVTTLRRTASTVTVLGAEGAAATLNIWADEGDDAADKWSLVSSNTGTALLFYQDATAYGSFNGTQGLEVFEGIGINVQALARGTGAVVGRKITVGRNSSGSGAAGSIAFQRLDGSLRNMWVDASGDVRIGSSSPTEDGSVSDTSGTVVGTQTSTLATKNLTGKHLEPNIALATILGTRVESFTYKSGAYNNTEFFGIIADWSPEFAMDNGRSFNPVSAFGYTVQAFKGQAAQIAALEARIAALEGR